MRIAPNGNIDPERQFPSMFEPVHGSAPDIAGKGVANPMAAILSASMMLDHLGYSAVAETVREAVQAVVERVEVLPSDMKGNASTSQIGDAVASALE